MTDDTRFPRLRCVLPHALIATALLAFTADPALARQAPEMPAKAAVPVAPDVQRQGFSIVLLLGDMQPLGDLQDTVPAAARRALADMRDFLPYKGYKLLDTQWTLCCSSSHPAITRLRGVDEQEYELELRSAMVGASALSVRFLLRESDGPLKRLAGDSGGAKAGAAAAAHAAQAADVNREILALEREELDLRMRAEQMRDQVKVGVKDKTELTRVEGQLEKVRRRILELKRQMTASTYVKADGRVVIDTSFRMDAGESVVVGTSRLKGGSRALIAILTAAPLRGGTR
jgi:hypothetical protein